MADVDTTHDRLRRLPAIHDLLAAPRAVGWLDRWPRPTVVRALQAAVDHARSAIQAGCDGDVDTDQLLDDAEREMTRIGRHRLRRVINATGIVLHTGLGRAPLAEAAIDAIAETARGYCNLELDLTPGRRGQRGQYAADLMREITGGEDVILVNNNAAATLLVLNSLAEGREVIVSRGQLIEIGGSFRLPDVMAKSGAILHEVGTTNRTRLDDYAAAVNERTGMFLHVHHSNYRIVGFTETVPARALVDLASKHGLLVYDDLGSGAVFDLTTLGLPGEPHIRESLRGGVDVLTFSGDKLFGGPQAGIIVGKKHLLARMRRNPLLRAFRVDKLTIAALEATLELYRDETAALAAVPTLAMLTASAATLRGRAERLRAHLQAAVPSEAFAVSEDASFAGGGSLPEQSFETWCVRWMPATATPNAVAGALRTGRPAVLARIHDDALIFDLRTIHDDDFEELVAAVRTAVASAPHARHEL